ncbi:sulfotransferase 1E1 [Octopus bimaculoides]|uniref:Sulfotransferase domain-containing protein n=1 Tax=Octopus bimaculoides TaxID=37653 RepID=A0A0L8I5F1_OCTBM|nr:sulfotransferase 1E1 [Octopus bimaculoides]|eukprot:XP_014790788.1 PREDICTED: estrogen sulfotransferase-like [Octopus bimaculoides]
MSKEMNPEEIKKEIESNFKQYFGKDGEPLSVYQYKGHNIMKFDIAVSALSKLHMVKIRPDDILMFSYPAAGSHWMFEIVNMILKGSTERVSLLKEDLLLDWSPFEKLDSIESPRLLNTHLPPELLPQELLKDHKMIFLNRNPKAMLVSFYRHILDVNLLNYKGDFLSYFDLWMQGEVPWDDYFKYVQEMYALCKDNPNALIITYEEIKADIPKAVSRVAKFLEKTIPDQLTKDIADMCSFDKMKSEKKLVSSYLPKDSLKDGGTVFHSGKVDTWKKWLTVEQSERIDARIQSEFVDQGIIFNF